MIWATPQSLIYVSIDFIGLNGWLAALDDFRNCLKLGPEARENT